MGTWTPITLLRITSHYTWSQSQPTHDLNHVIRISRALPIWTIKSLKNSLTWTFGHKREPFTTERPHMIVSADQVASKIRPVTAGFNILSCTHLSALHTLPREMQRRKHTCPSLGNPTSNLEWGKRSTKAQQRDQTSNVGPSCCEKGGTKGVHLRGSVTCSHSVYHCW